MLKKISIATVAMIVVLYVAISYSLTTPAVLRALAEHGNVDAQYDLAQKYYTGKGVEKDLHEAVKWYRKAAEQDLPEAIKWLRKAADQGHTKAKKLLAEIGNQ